MLLMFILLFRGTVFSQCSDS